MAPALHLACFRWHTGAEPTPVHPDSAPPLLYRDVGPAATAQFLRLGLKRLAGPMTPITYLRTAEYCEPYTDYARIGRLVVLRPMELQPWHAGLSHIYIAAAEQIPGPDALGFVPGGIDLHRATLVLKGARTANEAREAFAEADADAAREEHLAQLDCLNAEASATERLAQPLRIAFQVAAGSAREHLRELFARHGLDERDLCTAWHHLPAQRREWLNEILPQLGREAAPWTRSLS